MKCKVCGAASGKYPLCRACNLKKERGEVIKCPVCNNWHYVNVPCNFSTVPIATGAQPFLYEKKGRFISKAENEFYQAILNSLPQGYYAFPQVNLATFIEKTDDSRFHNELFRNVDFLITDSMYRPRFVIEINDQTHLTQERKERDEKVHKICEEAGIPILTLWTSYGVNIEYIRAKILEIISSPPPARVHHFSQAPVIPTNGAVPLGYPQGGYAFPTYAPVPMQTSSTKKGCYVATCVYGSYDCPSVWTLRRYRDQVLAKKVVGRAFIRCYYKISPWLVSVLGEKSWFVSSCRSVLNWWIARLNQRGIEDTPYSD